jgi:uncharacterized damage-inducible protein DinB
MNENYLARLFELNVWANEQLVRVCLTLTDEQLDAEPTSATYGSIRQTLLHLASSQEDYLQQLTLPLEARLNPITLTFEAVASSLQKSGSGLLALARDSSGIDNMTQIRSSDGYGVEPWVLLAQAINHADEHREQIKSMLTALGIIPPRIDGWRYGASVGALVKLTG